MLAAAEKDESKRPKHVVLSDTIALVKELQVKVGSPDPGSPSIHMRWGKWRLAYADSEPIRLCRTVPAVEGQACARGPVWLCAGSSFNTVGV